MPAPGSLPIHRRITVRVSLAVATVLCAIGGGLFFIDAALVRARETAGLERRSGEVARDIVDKAAAAWEAHRPERIPALLALLAAQREIEDICLLDAGGVVRFSSQPARIGQVLATDQAQCRPCHDPPGPVADGAVFTTVDGSARLVRAVAVAREPRCVACHTPADRTLGVLIVEVNTDRLEAELSDHRKLAAVMVSITFLAAFLVVVLLLHRGVQRPLAGLLAATRKVEAGDFSARLPEERGDELGMLSRSFNGMVARLSDYTTRLEDTVASRTEELLEIQRSLGDLQRHLMRTDRLATMGEMAAAVAHEVRTPLSAVGLNLHLVRRRLSEPGESHNDEVEVIVGEIKRIDQVIDRFLALARFPAPRIEPTAVNGPVKTVLELLAPEARRAGVTIARALADPSPVALCDDDRLRHVLVNLVINSIQAMPDGGELRVETRHDQPIITVSDDGPGLAPDIRDRVFKPFVSNKPTGTGLGLAIAARLLREVGGSIRYRDRPAGGAEFALEIPFEEVA